MSKCDYPNHCPDLKQAGENLLRQELNIKELEQQKAELLKFIQHLYVNYHLPYGAMDIETKKKFEEIRSKYK